MDKKSTIFDLYMDHIMSAKLIRLEQAPTYIVMIDPIRKVGVVYHAFHTHMLPRPYGHL